MISRKNQRNCLHIITRQADPSLASGSKRCKKSPGIPGHVLTSVRTTLALLHVFEIQGVIRVEVQSRVGICDQMLFDSGHRFAGVGVLVSVFLGRSDARRQVLAQTVNAIVVKHNTVAGMLAEYETAQRIKDGTVFEGVLGIIDDTAIFNGMATAADYKTLSGNANLFYP